MVHISPLHLSRVRDTLEDTLRRPQGDIRIRQLTGPPQRANAETQILRQKSGESIAYKSHKYKIDLDWRRMATFLQLRVVGEAHDVRKPAEEAVGKGGPADRCQVP